MSVDLSKEACAIARAIAAGSVDSNESAPTNFPVLSSKDCCTS
eukprot:CAMPEP_0180498470 /NCGR_PEP_ID=MMETSP1036_2-20121128/43353_1 /TAXON_ID=632150 /ORGANISM="Azadinium spinosum, Strain 3D9" /LENGTH=42 /DNA_ID= /DNA_START= /DNA_END= /DNA_ORIENTATION=